MCSCMYACNWNPFLKSIWKLKKTYAFRIAQMASLLVFIFFDMLRIKFCPYSLKNTFQLQNSNLLGANTLSVMRIRNRYWRPRRHIISNPCIALLSTSMPNLRRRLMLMLLEVMSLTSGKIYAVSCLYYFWRWNWAYQLDVKHEWRNAYS